MKQTTKNQNPLTFKKPTMKNLFISLLLLSFAIGSGQTTATALKAQIDTDITNKTAAQSITKTAVGGNMKAVVDFVTQQAPSKTQENVTLSGTPSVLPADLNMCSFTNGIGYLPTTTVIGKEVYVFANQDCTIQANAGNTNGLYVDRWGGLATSVFIKSGKSARFIYLGGGFWSVEFMNKRVKAFSGLISQSGTSAPTVTVGENDFAGTFTYSRVSAGVYRITFPANSLNGAVVYYYFQPITNAARYAAQLVGANILEINTVLSDGTDTDGIMTDVPFKIEAKY